MGFDIFYLRDNLHKISKPIFWENKKTISESHLLKCLSNMLSVKTIVSLLFLF